MSRPRPTSGARPFERDIALTGRYLYTDGERLSSRLANERMTAAVLAATRWEGARVIDIGCGDGTYTHELAKLGGTAHVHGVDPAAEAIEVARARGGDAISFQVADAEALPHPSNAFDVALLRGVLHHVEQPRVVLAEALRVAAKVVAVEPNGLNLGLKLLERVSTYHREHGERSYPPRVLDAWVAAVGGRTAKRQWVGFVPMFCADAYARLAKRAETPLERLPGLRTVACAQYVFTAHS